MPVLFVYGTLRRPADGPDADTHYHHRIADTIDMAEKATLFGAAIYDLGSYPGVGPAESSASVRGEVFELSNEGLAIADEIEGHPTFYERREATIVLDNGMGGSAWVYWARGIDECTLIVANLNGITTDDGTAWELGYAFANGKHSIGYFSDWRRRFPNDEKINLMMEESLNALVENLDQLQAAIDAWKAANR